MVTPSTTVTISGATTSTGPVLDTKASEMAMNTVTTKLSSRVANDLIVAFVSADGPTSTTQTSKVTGGGLTWTLQKRINAQWGASEVWTARASGLLSNAAITSKLAKTGNYADSLTVASYSGATGSTFATAAASKSNGAPTLNLTTTAANSLVVGVGNDWTSAKARTVGAGQALVNQAFGSADDTFWVQTRTAITPSVGTVVTINDTAPTSDMWNLAAIAIS